MECLLIEKSKVSGLKMSSFITGPNCTVYCTDVDAVHNSLLHNRFQRFIAK